MQKYNLISLYNIIFMNILRADHLELDNQLVDFSWERLLLFFFSVLSFFLIRYFPCLRFKNPKNLLLSKRIEDGQIRMVVT